MYCNNTCAIVGLKEVLPFVGDRAKPTCKRWPKAILLFSKNKNVMKAQKQVLNVQLYHMIFLLRTSSVASTFAKAAPGH